jgi:hypothetical protein
MPRRREPPLAFLDIVLGPKVDAYARKLGSKLSQYQLSILIRVAANPEFLSRPGHLGWRDDLALCLMKQPDVALAVMAFTRKRLSEMEKSKKGRVLRFLVSTNPVFRRDGKLLLWSELTKDDIVRKWYDPDLGLGVQRWILKPHVQPVTVSDLTDGEVAQLVSRQGGGVDKDTVKKARQSLTWDVIVKSYTKGKK